MMHRVLSTVRRSFGVGAMLLGAGAYGEEPLPPRVTPGNCGASGSPALAVTVRDSLMGAYAATHATFTRTIGVFESKARHPGPG